MVAVTNIVKTPFKENGSERERESGMYVSGWPGEAKALYM